MSSRSLNDLHPEFRTLVDAWLVAVKAAGLSVLVTCTYASKYVNLGWRYDGTGWLQQRALTGN